MINSATVEVPGSEKASNSQLMQNVGSKRNTVLKKKINN